MESPKVTLEGVQPDVVCNAQFPAEGPELTLRGTGITPLPVQVLEEPARKS